MTVRFLRLPAIASLAVSAAFCGTFRVSGRDPGPWPAILRSAGFVAAAGGAADVWVVRAGESGDPAPWALRAEEGAFVLLEGESAIATALGFRPGADKVRVASVEDKRQPRLDIIWERPLDLPVFSVPGEARVFASERWRGAPLIAGFQRGAGAVLWVAAAPGTLGYERFPYLLHALADLGLAPPFHSRRLWAFFDSSYHSRVDLEYFARRWRSAGILALHVAAWHYFEPESRNDGYLQKLIETCHRNGILVYAWLELPHVSEKFWNGHPEWREKTALLQDAHLDWRKLMNLSHPECARAVLAGVRGLVGRFDWDGLNLAELYFESLEGHGNPSRFTPMNDDVRREFRRTAGFDPIDLFDGSSPRHHSKNPSGLRSFLDFRAALSRRIQIEWVTEMEQFRRWTPDLDLVLTHVDDRLDSGMRDAIGADAAQLLASLGNRPVTFLVEDPATVWSLGPDRYRDLAGKYESLTSGAGRLAIDINIVERYQDVYPTKQQTGTELFQLVHQAALSFSRVALYFESSIPAADAGWLASASSPVERFERRGAKFAVESRRAVGVAWKGAALVDGRLWPALDGDTLWLPGGAHVVERADSAPTVRLLDLAGDLTAAAAGPRGMEFAYESQARALARLDRRPRRVVIDGVEAHPETVETETGVMLRLPRGQHLVEIEVE